MFFKVLFFKLLPWVLPIDYNAYIKLLRYYFENNFTGDSGNLAILLAFSLFLYKDIYRVLRDFILGSKLIFITKRDLYQVYSRYNGFFFVFYLVALILIKTRLNYYTLSIIEESYLFIAVGVFALIPSVLRFVGKELDVYWFLWPLLMGLSLLFTVEGVPVLLVLVVIFRVFSIDKTKANTYAFLSLFVVFLVHTSYYHFDIYELLWGIILFAVLKLVDILLKRKNFYEISVFYILVGAWTILDLFFS